MNAHPSISVVIPTIGRPSLASAVDSALTQSARVLEIIVVADTAEPLTLPTDDRIRVLRTGPGSGGANARQFGIQQATGEVIALLDDDDLWHPYKLERQLAEVSKTDGSSWVVTCKCAVREPGHREKIWPRTLIGERQSVADYLFTLHHFTLGDAILQSSTLCFPRRLAFEVPLNYAPQSIHDEPGWLIELQRKVPDLAIKQVPECFSIYNVSENSVSRRSVDLSEKYIEWGREHLRDATARVRGDYFLFSAVTAAASAQSLRGIRKSVVSGFSEGRPGLPAMVYAAAKFGRTALWQVRAHVD
ncbi:glycosyltransferase family 2 protein [Rhodococcus sp. KRD162]|uniref:glycosyltransferase family 2 protein n=1 Tax=Rhodococcus sp. KRD162 TaxID=2729725 RepID=UPI0019D2954C|nr:glycosyltransferase family 2 protein [Rhodococcus sp. KRD162]